jgi:hypothetical protein
MVDLRDGRSVTMRRMVAVLAVVLAGCADPAQAPTPPSPSASAAGATTSEAASSAPTSFGISVTGVLGGDAQLEGGCVWLETDDGRVEPLLPEGYTATTDPVALVGPEGETIAEEGDRVTVTGIPTSEGASICQVGNPFTVTDVTVADGG